MRREVGRRLAIAHTAFGLHRKILFTNGAFSMKKRVQLFSTLVLTKLTYGMESWDLRDTKTKHKLHNGITRLYRRLLGGAHDRHLTDQEILAATELPSPSVLLRQARLRYLGSLYVSGPRELWSVLHADTAWTSLVTEDIQWMWNQLQRSSSLTSPTDDFGYWEFLMRRYPGYWKRLVKRAVIHDTLQAKNRHVVDRAHVSLVNILQEFGTLPDEIPQPTRTTTQDNTERTLFGCLFCERSCKTRAGEAVHMQRKHGHNSRLRYLYDGTSCPACLREYHLPERVHQHLRTALRCRRYLQEHGMLMEPAIGAGTKAHQAYEARHNRLAPFLEGHGPKNWFQPPAPGEGQDLPEHFDAELICDIESCFEQYADLPDLHLLAELKAKVKEKPRSWTTLYVTVGYTLDELKLHPPDDSDHMAIRYCQIGRQLIDESNWPFLGTHERAIPYQEGQCEQYLAKLVMHPTAQWRAHAIPRQFGRERYFLHLFSGRRRPGDLQYYLDQYRFADFTLYTVSIDIMVDEVRGDLMREESRQFWFRAIRQRYAVAMLGGPPCETWSQARTRPSDSLSSGSSGPRAVRDELHPWGMESLGIGELQQTIFGATLFLFVLEAFCLMYVNGGAALVEHPAEPSKEGCATIWRLAITALLQQLPNVEKIRVLQGALGSESAKPTDLLHTGLPTLATSIADHAVFKQTGKVSIGKDEFGRYKTARLKEYPPALNRALARAFAESIERMPVDTSIHLPVLDVASLLQAGFGKTFGPDFAPGNRT